MIEQAVNTEKTVKRKRPPKMTPAAREAWGRFWARIFELSDELDRITAGRREAERLEAGAAEQTGQEASR